ncbi:MAG: hypothetical protein ACRC62_18660 [Microcoleus sp.]
MKGRSLLTITLSLAILSATSLPIVAQSSRLPTDAEMQELIKKFRHFAANPPNENREMYIKDRRDRTQIQQITSFVKARSQIDPTTAPFLGQWVAYEETKSIYPSNIKDRVCINQPGIYEYAWPRPLKTPAELMRHIPQNDATRDRIMKQFQQAGCTASLPNRR